MQDVSFYTNNLDHVGVAAHESTARERTYHILDLEQHDVALLPNVT